MLLKTELATIPFLKPPKKKPKNGYCSATAEIHNLPRSGDILVIDAFKDESKIPIFRFFSDGNKYISLMEPERKAEWATFNPFRKMGYGDYEASDESVKAAKKIISSNYSYVYYTGTINGLVGAFIYNVHAEKMDKARERKYALMDEHFGMFPEYPADLEDYCENHVFDHTLAYISKSKDKERKAVCRHCRKKFNIPSSIVSGKSGKCPECGIPVIYRGNWIGNSIEEKTKICIAAKVDNQLLLRWVNVSRTFTPDRKMPIYTFSDYFRNLFLHTPKGDVEYSYKYFCAMYYGWNWYRLENGSECWDSTFVYSNNLKEVFGERYYNVDLAQGLSGNKREIKFRQLLNNLKNTQQAEYLFKAGLPHMASNFFAQGTDGRSFEEVVGVSKQYLPSFKKANITFQEAVVVKAVKRWVPENDILLLCSFDLNAEALGCLKEIMAYISLGKTLRYLQKQWDKLPSLLRRRGWKYLLTIYRDYLSMASALDTDMTVDAILKPRNLKDRHDVLVARTNEKKTQIENARIQAAIKNGLYSWMQNYDNEDYIIVYPQLFSHFITEGQCLNHCVGSESYLNRHIQGGRMVFFIREKYKPEVPFFTLEVNMQTFKVAQCYGFGDCSATKEVRAFAESFTAAIKRWSKAERMVG